MISLKKYLDASSDGPNLEGEPEENNVLPSVLQAYRSALCQVGKCSLEVCPSLGADLKESLETLDTKLSGRIDRETFSTAERDVQRRLQQWSTRAVEYYRQKTNEIKDLLIVMAQTADSFGARDLRYSAQLMDITHMIEKIASLEDLADVRASIKKNAAELRASVDRMTKEGEQAIKQLRAETNRVNAKLEQAEESASRDVLSGLRNRLWMEKEIERRISSGAAFCMAIIDINGFKRANDEYGHLVGDGLLQEFAACLQSAVRSTDVIGRWGGDEFVLVVDGSLHGGLAQLNRITSLVSRSYIVQASEGPLKLKVDVSTGLAEHIPGGTMRELLGRADAAMYVRKRIFQAESVRGEQVRSSIERTDPAPPPGLDGGRSNAMRILIAEDDATSRKLLQGLLSRYGECDIALNGMEAVDAVRIARENHRVYELVCMDLGMPLMSGQEAIREIRKQETMTGATKAVPIIVTTTYVDLENIASALLERCNAYLVKPIDAAKLQKELKHLGLIQSPDIITFLR
jgi:two-component system chemotaxis response regulator CheY